MPRKPNYKFERMERERGKAAKKAARDEAKREKCNGLVPLDFHYQFRRVSYRLP